MIRVGIAGLIGYESAYRLLDQHREELEKRFSRRFIKDFMNLSMYLIEERADTATESFYLSAISDGGLWAALWKACEDIRLLSENPGKTNVGCRIKLNDIYIHQEIIEIDELYGENPYETSSKGAYLIIWDEDKEKYLGDNEKELIAGAKVIGLITNEKKRILSDGENERFLTPPERQKKDIEDRNCRKLRK